MSERSGWVASRASCVDPPWTRRTISLSLLFKGTQGWQRPPSDGKTNSAAAQKGVQALKEEEVSPQVS